MRTYLTMVLKINPTRDLPLHALPHPMEKSHGVERRSRGLGKVTILGVGFFFFKFLFSQQALCCSSHHFVFFPPLNSLPSSQTALSSLLLQKLAPPLPSGFKGPLPHVPQAQQPWPLAGSSLLASAEHDLGNEVDNGCSWLVGI